MSNASGVESSGPAMVYVIDDDEAMRESLAFLFESVGLPVQAFASGRAFLDAHRSAMQGCLLLDVRMPGMSGLDLQERLQERNIRLPIVFMTAYADVPMAVRAMRTGAVDFIEKPFNEQQLLDCIQRALKHDRVRRKDREKLKPIEQRLERLTPREGEVMELVVKGLLNKQIASQLQLSVKTVEQHRARVMEKMDADSLAELVRMALAVGAA